MQEPIRANYLIPKQYESTHCFPLVILVFITAISASATGESSIPADYQPNNAGNGGRANWLPANKTGFGTSYSTASNVWFTLQGGRLSEVYYPRLDTPSVRNLDFVVTDGQSFAVRVQDASTSLTRLANPDYHQRKELHAWFKSEEVADSLTYQIVNTDTAKRWRLTTTFVTDPSRPTLLIDVEFVSLDGRPYQLYAIYQPQLNNPLIEAPLKESVCRPGDYRSFRDFVDLVVPELQRRGIYKKEYRPGTCGRSYSVGAPICTKSIRVLLIESAKSKGR